MKVAVRYYPGNGTEYDLEVVYISDYPRGVDGTCAFCKGDPCVETPAAPYRIRQYHETCPWSGTCPMCLGRPT